jgi:hypothetical protein
VVIFKKNKSPPLRAKKIYKIIAGFILAERTHYGKKIFEKYSTQET